MANVHFAVQVRWNMTVVMNWKIMHILIFPNIELRLNTFVGRDAHAVNYHVVFSDTVADHDIEQNFPNQLQLVYKPGSTLPLARDNIRRIGKEYKENNGGKGDDYAVGLEQAVVSYDMAQESSMDSTYNPLQVATEVKKMAAAESGK